jgi:hypothetical protein
MKLDLGFSFGTARRYNIGAPAPAPGPYLPNLSSSALAVWGARRMVEGYAGNLYKLRRASDDAVLDVAVAAGADLPDYAAITVWAGGSALFVTDVYDQSGNGKTLMQGTAGRQPYFDPTQALAGCTPFTLAGVHESATDFQWMTTGATLSMNRQDISVWTVLHSSITQQKQALWALFSGGSMISNCFVNPDLGIGTSIYDSALRSFGGGSWLRAQPSVLGANFDANIVLNVRETALTTANGASAAFDTFRLGESQWFSNIYNSQFHCWGVCLYPDLSSTDQGTLRAALETMFSIPTAFTSRLIFSGDSIIEGTGATFLKNMPNQLTGLPGTPEIFNFGVWGRSLSTESSSYSAQVAPLFTSAYGAGKCILVIESGSNDLNVSAVSATTQEGAVSSYVTAAKATGFKVGLATVTPATAFTVGEETERVAYNNWVMAGSSGADFTIDAATATNMSNPPDTAYYVDGVHPTSIGYQRLASSRYGPALAAALA